MGEAKNIYFTCLKFALSFINHRIKMSSIGTGYDLSASQFSPDGRVFQVEYAQKAVENSGTSIALKGKDGVVFAVEKLVTSKLYENGANRRIFSVDTHIGMAVAGLLADSRQIFETARKEASNYRSEYGNNIPVKYLADRVAMYKHTLCIPLCGLLVAQLPWLPMMTLMD